MKIAIFYHCVFRWGNPLVSSQSAKDIIYWQMRDLEASGLVGHASFMLAGINDTVAPAVEFPRKFFKVFHGTQSRSENLTIVEIEKWVKAHPDYYVLYFHSKGATKPSNSPGPTQCRLCMMRACVKNWYQCVRDLDAGSDSVGCHWLPGMADGTQNIWAGNFWWAKASYLRTLPSIFERARIKESGIGAIESRYEAEVWIGNGPRLPKVKDYHPGGRGVCF